MKQMKRGIRRARTERVVKKRITIVTCVWGHELNKEGGIYKKQSILGCNCHMCKYEKHFDVPDKQRLVSNINMKEVE